MSGDHDVCPKCGAEGQWCMCGKEDQYLWDRIEKLQQALGTALDTLVPYPCPYCHKKELPHSKSCLVTNLRDTLEKKVMKHYEIDEEADEWMNAPMGSYQPNDELTHLRAENKQLKKKMEELALLASMSRVAYENGLINGLKGLNPGVVNMKDMDDYFNAWEESMKKEKHNMGFYVLIFLVSCIVAYKLANRKSSKK